jgi:hypothetical protein
MRDPTRGWRRIGSFSGNDGSSPCQLLLATTDFTQPLVKDRTIFLSLTEEYVRSGGSRDSTRCDGSFNAGSDRATTEPSSIELSKTCAVSHNNQFKWRDFKEWRQAMPAALNHERAHNMTHTSKPGIPTLRRVDKPICRNLILKMGSETKMRSCR